MAEISVVSCAAVDAAEQFTDSLHHTGFAVLKDHSLDMSLINRVYRDWHTFFTGPDVSQFSFSEETHDGHVPCTRSEVAKGAVQADLKEFYHYYPHGRCPESLRDITQSAYDQAFQLAHTLLDWCESALPQAIQQSLSVPLSSMIDGSEHTLLRILHYPPIGNDVPVGAVRAMAHEDINLLTVLPAATAKGLQAQTIQGAWFDVPCDPDWVIINSGDMLQECTDRYYPSTTHQVLNPEGEDQRRSRMSMPLFLHPSHQVRLSARYTAEEYYQERMRALGLLS